MRRNLSASMRNLSASMPNLPTLRAVRRFADVTTLHGIKDLFSTDSRTIRVFWLLLLFVTSGLMVYETERILETFFEEPIATNIRLQKMTRHKLANIITPYICLYDWMSKSRAEEMYSPEQILALDSFSNQETMKYIVNEVKNTTRKRMIMAEIKYFQEKMMYNNLTLEDLYTPITKNFSFVPRTNDSRFLMRQIFLIDSVCFPINLDAATDVVGVPIYRKDIDLQSDDTIDELAYSVHMKKEVTFTFYQGANARYFSDIDRVIANFTVDSGAHQLNLRMRFKKLVHLPRRVLPCTEYETEDKDSKYPVNYMRQICMQKCMDKNIYREKYNCTFMVPKSNAQRTLITLPHTRDFPLCTADKFFFSKAFTMNDNVRVRACQDGCESLQAYCTEWDIQNERVRWVPPRSCNSTGCLNLAIVAQPTLEVSEEVLLMTFDTLLSNIGGQAGLWFGGSILSIIQLVFFCFLYGTCKCSKRQRKKSTPKTTPMVTKKQTKKEKKEKKKNNKQEMKKNKQCKNRRRDENANLTLPNSSTVNTDLDDIAQTSNDPMIDFIRNIP